MSSSQPAFGAMFRELIELGVVEIDTYIDRHGVAGLATSLTYAVARERGEVTHRLMAKNLDISPLAAEMILQALRLVVHEHYDIEVSGTSLNEVDIDNGDATDDA